MKIKKVLGLIDVILGTLILAFPLKGMAQETILGLQQAISLAEKASPSLKASAASEREAREFSRIEESALFPTLDVAAVDSGGFPGSASGFGDYSGLVASPYRKGPAFGAFSKWELLDLSAWHGVDASHFAVSANHEKGLVQRARVDQQVLGVYLEAVRARGDRDAWQKLVLELTGVKDTVQRFVRNGQYSEVQNLLIQDQLDDASVRVAEFGREYQASLDRMALLTGLDAKNLACPGPEGISEDELQGMEGPGTSPLVAQADFEVKAARETVAQYSAENLPRLEVAGSAGYLSDTRLEQAQDYSVFVGVSMPIFEGFRIDAQEKRARAETEVLENEEAADQLAVDDLNVQYDEQIEESREELRALVLEQERSLKAVELAKARYIGFLSPLSDLQQALKDMVNTEIQVGDVKTKLVLSVGGKLFLNGGTIQSRN